MSPGQVFALCFLLGGASIGGLVAIMIKTGIGRAIAHRIAGTSMEPDARLLAEVDGLRSEVDQLHEQLAEVHERLDFSERLLASGRGDSTPPVQ